MICLRLIFRLSLLLCLLLTCACQDSPSGGSQIEQVGDPENWIIEDFWESWGGNELRNALEIVETRNGDFLVLVPEGLLRSADNGQTWTVVDSQQSTISLYPSPFSDVVFRSLSLGFEQWGCDRSQDLGENWENSPLFILIRDFAFLENGRILAGGSGFSPHGGIYHSDDGGLSWEQRNPINFSMAPLRFHVSSTGEIFLVGGDVSGTHILRSDDNGGSWTELNSQFGMVFWPDIDLKENSQGDFFMNAPGGVWRSKDHGVTWENMPESIRSRSFVIDSNDNILSGFGGIGSVGLRYYSALRDEWFEVDPDLIGSFHSIYLDRNNFAYIITRYNKVLRSVRPLTEALE